MPQKTNVELSKASGEVEFFAVGNPSLLRIHGKGVAPGGKFAIDDNENVTGEGSFDLSSLDTGIDMRNKHMKEKYLQVEKFPVASLKMSEMVLPLKSESLSWKFENVPFKALLTLHGQTKPVEGLAKVSRKEDRIELSCEFSIKLADFGIDIPSYAGITIANDVRVHVRDSSSILKK